MRPQRRATSNWAWLAATLALAGLLAACGGGSDAAKSHGLVVRNVTIDEPINGKNAAVRLTIDNTTGTNDRLLAASSDGATRVTLHRSTSDDEDRSVMKEIDGVDIPAGKKVVFKAGGLHIMLNDFKHPIEVGDVVDVTLTFEHAGRQTVDAKVVPIGENGQGGAGGMDGAHDMSDMD